jgi:hypothetical protein
MAPAPAVTDTAAWKAPDHVEVTLYVAEQPPEAGGVLAGGEDGGCDDGGCEDGGADDGGADVGGVLVPAPPKLMSLHQ